MKFIPPPSARSPGLLRKAATLIAAVALVGVALMFSAVLLVIILFLAVFGGAYLWWKTRTVRKLMREMQNFASRREEAAREVYRGEVFEGQVIEGEAIRVDEPRPERRH